jgi:hypothetical protein
MALSFPPVLLQAINAYYNPPLPYPYVWRSETMEDLILEGLEREEQWLSEQKQQSDHEQKELENQILLLNKQLRATTKKDNKRKRISTAGSNSKRRKTSKDSSPMRPLSVSPQGNSDEDVSSPARQANTALTDHTCTELTEKFKSFADIPLDQFRIAPW